MSNKRAFKNLLVTGGAGFIGSNMIRYLLTEADFDGRIINLDKLTYAGNASSLEDMQEASPDRYILKQGDICDAELVKNLFSLYEIDAVCHLAAESHVDRSIEGPKAFIKTNVNGTFTLLDAARKPGMETLKVSSFIMFQLMKFTVPWVVRDTFMKPLPTIPVVHILPVKPLPIIW